MFEGCHKRINANAVKLNYLKIKSTGFQFEMCKFVTFQYNLMLRIVLEKKAVTVRFVTELYQLRERTIFYLNMVPKIE